MEFLVYGCLRLCVIHWGFDHERTFLYVLVTAFTFEADNLVVSLYFAPFSCVALGVLFMDFP